MSSSRNSSSRSTLRLRVGTAVVGIPLVLACLLLSTPYPSIALLAAVCFQGCLELQKLLAPGSKAPSWLMPGLASAGVVILLVFHPIAPSEVARHMGERWVLLGLFAVGLAVASGPPHFARAPIAMLWVACPMVAIGLLQHARVGEPVGPWAANLALVAIVPIWLGDSAAYFIGRSVGKHPLAPSISPKKTWEGAIANLVGCMIGSLACGVAMGLPTLMAILVGLTQGVVGQFGDLFESRLKRLSQVKDAGALLPGHGGILDRTDSLLATAPLVAILVSAR